MKILCCRQYELQCEEVIVMLHRNPSLMSSIPAVELTIVVMWTMVKLQSNPFTYCEACWDLHQSLHHFCEAIYLKNAFPYLFEHLTKKSSEQNRVSPS